jgi:cellulose synthase/poly-beta-1,6-N-acetylglucosamine synthase-like glycosyltransferase
MLGVLHTYVLYPWWVVSGARTQVQGKVKAQVSEGPWPPVAVLMAAHNEASVINEKLQSLAAQNYPGQLNVYIGSDCSTDQTNDILTAWAEKDSRFHPTLYTTRQGKPGIINQLVKTATLHPPTSTLQLIITDASVILRPNTITELIRPMREDERIGVVDATMIQTGGTEDGIGQAEESYIDREVTIKRAEGRRWGAMVGPFGGCWAIRAEAYTPVPDNFLVDDFFLCMAAYEQGYLGISRPEAVVEEAVGQSIKDEFRRKVRISSGNWQNLIRFRKLWWPFWKNPLAFAFFSHKVLRWWTPFLLLIGGIAWAILIVSSGYESNYWFGVLFATVVNVPIFLLLLDIPLSILGVNFRPARYTHYFLAMNAALLVGFYRYLTGIKSNVWQPSQRH